MKKRCIEKGTQPAQGTRATMARPITWGVKEGFHNFDTCFFLTQGLSSQALLAQGAPHNGRRRRARCPRAPAAGAAALPRRRPPGAGGLWRVHPPSPPRPDRLCPGLPVGQHHRVQRDDAGACTGGRCWAGGARGAGRDRWKQGASIYRELIAGPLGVQTNLHEMKRCTRQGSCPPAIAGPQPGACRPS